MVFARGERGRYQLVVTKSSWKRLKLKLKAITRKTNPMSLDERLVRLAQVLRGLINYFRLASIHKKLKALDSWLRNRLRYCIWHHWKKPEKKRRSHTRLGGWRVAQSPILGTTITVERLNKRGYLDLLDYYHQRKLH